MSKEEGELLSVEALFQKIKALQAKIEGVSISGGEPLEQRESLCALLEQIKNETAFSVLLFTGFYFHEIEAMPDGKKLLQLVDILVAGPYRQDQACSPKGLISSLNQRVHFLSQRYGSGDLLSVPEAEVIIEPEGDFVLTGILSIEG